MIIAHPKRQALPVAVHVVPLDIDDERALALLDRYIAAIDAGEHPPFPYIAAVFAEIHAILTTRREEGGA